MTDGIMDFMAQDHYRLDGIFRQFRSQKNTSFLEAQKLFLEFKGDLERHIVWEEEILFPLFERHTGMYGEGPTAVMRLEHRQIKEFLQKIRDKAEKKDTDTSELELGLIEILRAHNEKEEGVLYPWFDDSLSAKEREGAFTKMRSISSK